MIIQCKVFERSTCDTGQKYLDSINDFLSKIEGQDVVFINVIGTGGEIIKDVVYIFYKQYEGKPKV